MAENPRKRSPNFPYASVRECVQNLTRLHAQVQTNKVPLVIAFRHMGLGPNSSSTDRIRASMSSYKLTTEEVVGREKFIRITDLANRIVVDTRENERLAACREAALSDSMMKRVWEGEWKRGLPADDATIISVLRLEFKFQEEAAKRFTTVLKDNYRFCDLATYYEVPTTDELETPPPPPPGGGAPKKPPVTPDETGELTRYPIPLDQGRFAYIFLPIEISENDAVYVPDFVNLLLRKLRKSKDNNAQEEPTDENN